MTAGDLFRLAGGFIGERWGRVDLGVLPHAHLAWVLGISVVAGLLLCLTPMLWRVFRIAVTVVHELGHAATGLLAGRRLHGITVRRDMSGTTVTSGRPRGTGMVLTSWFGYPVPGLVGAALLWLALLGWAPATLTVLVAIMVPILVMARSLFTAFVFLLSLLALAALWWLNDPDVSGASLVVLGVLLQLGGARAVAGLIRDHAGGRTAHSDAAALGRVTVLPAPFWLGTFALAALAALGFSGFLLSGVYR